ncbi:hypothetical protein STCU_10766 [Strigomonas culicis]|uniref:Uncharacterized protein n=1 Tax=Strigomonas culicis TaxID=28005 RepID=S9TK40_9TRYP|nr:hypothetical protein STCU_10766 [Strigomonas culicis]|eukprot:EPY17189.1 hypothetical protein STCU_10766 [Strigomonas culicis]
MSTMSHLSMWYNDDSESVAPSLKVPQMTALPSATGSSLLEYTSPLSFTDMLNYYECITGEHAAGRSLYCSMSEPCVMMLTGSDSDLSGSRQSVSMRDVHIAAPTVVPQKGPTELVEGIQSLRPADNMRRLSVVSPLLNDSDVGAHKTARKSNPLAVPEIHEDPTTSLSTHFMREGQDAHCNTENTSGAPLCAAYFQNVSEVRMTAADQMEVAQLSRPSAPQRGAGATRENSALRIQSQGSTTALPHAPRRQSVLHAAVCTAALAGGGQKRRGGLVITLKYIHV